MVRVAGIDLPRNKRVEFALPYIYGVGLTLSRKILKQADIDFGMKSDDLSESDVVRLREILNQYKIEGDLRKDIALNIKRLIEIGSYRGLRHKKSLPCRGQRTKTNARTRRGSKKTVAGKKK